MPERETIERARRARRGVMKLLMTTVLLILLAGSALGGCVVAYPDYPYSYGYDRYPYAYGHPYRHGYYRHWSQTP